MYQIRYDHLLSVFGACIEPNYHAIIIEYMPLGYKIKNTIYLGLIVGGFHFK